MGDKKKDEFPITHFVEGVKSAMGSTNTKPEADGFQVLVDAVIDWWVDNANNTAGPIAMKAAQYGSNSLAQMGRLWARAQGREVDTAQALELGCMLYAYGKMERWIDAALRGDQPSTDTLHDIAVYATMAQRIRETGSWP